jgi:single-strand DNA-binding protein
VGKINSKIEKIMEQLNRIELRGNVGNVRVSEAGSGKVARFSLATNYMYQNKEGSGTVETTWHNVVAWESRSIPDLGIIEKGCPLYVCGRLRSTKYTAADGTEKQSYEVIASKICKAEGQPSTY